MPAKREERYKIAVLGGSTTDGELYPFRSWPECLSDRVDQDYISIYNYGVSAYSSGQELIRLLRDIICQKPDLVLAFNGVNDAFLKNTKNIFDFDYLRSVMEFAARNLENRMCGDNKKLYCGEETHRDGFSQWLSIVELMGAIADFCHIQFFDFLQPMLHDKPKKSKGEELLVSASKDFFEGMISFRTRFSGLKEKNAHIIDLSDIFDEVHDVYIDICHVNEKGNGIIAENIYHAIRPVLQKWKICDKTGEGEASHD